MPRFMKSMVIAAALGACLGFGVGCSHGPADEWTELVDDFCNCSDVACADAVRAELAAFDQSRLAGKDYHTLMLASRKAAQCADQDLTGRASN